MVCIYGQQLIYVCTHPFCDHCSHWETVGGHGTHVTPTPRTWTPASLPEGVCVGHIVGVLYRTPGLQAVCGGQVVGGGVSRNHFQVNLGGNILRCKDIHEEPHTRDHVHIYVCLMFLLVQCLYIYMLLWVLSHV